MRKRAGLARALALDPDVLFFDEPSAGLDPITSSRLDDLIINLRDGLGATIIIVSHELPSLFAIADDGVFLDAETKTAIAHGSPAQMRDTSTDPQVEAFMRRERPEALAGAGGMSLDRNTMVGAFVVGGIGLGVAAAVMFGKFNLFSPAMRAAVVFQGSIGGLAVGSPVTFRGVPIGAVDGIGINYDPSTNIAFIPVTVRLEPGRALITPSRRGARRIRRGRCWCSGASGRSCRCRALSPANRRSTSTSRRTRRWTFIRASSRCRKFRRGNRRSSGHATNSASCRCATWQTMRWRRWKACGA